MVQWLNGVGLALGFIGALMLARGTVIATRNGNRYGISAKEKQESDQLTIGGIIMIALAFALQLGALLIEF